jgi:hypothetical protein
VGFGSRAFLAGSLGFAAAFVVACGGGSGLLSGDQSSSLSSQLQSISVALGSHQCGSAASAATSLNNAVANLPSTVNTTLLQNLGQGAATVGQLASSDCQSTSATTSSSSTGTGTSSSSSSATATNPPTPGTSSTSNGGAGIGGGTGTSGNGGNGQ